MCIIGFVEVGSTVYNCLTSVYVCERRMYLCAGTVCNVCVSNVWAVVTCIFVADVNSIILFWPQQNYSHTPCAANAATRAATTNAVTATPNAATATIAATRAATATTIAAAKIVVKPSTPIFTDNNSNGVNSVSAQFW